MPLVTLDAIIHLIGTTLARYLPMVILLAPFAYLAFRWVKRRRDEIARHAKAGTIGPAFVVEGATMPLHFDLLARVGTSGGAEQALQEKVLRPSVGVRLLILVISALVLGQFFLPRFAQGMDEALAELPVSPLVVQGLVLLAVANGVIYIFSCEARYDTSVLIVSRMLVFRREFLWKNLERIGDDGRYELVLIFRPGGKAKVLRYSQGIRDFKDYALKRLQENKVTDARTARS